MSSKATTPEGVLIGLNQKFTRESRLNPMPHYSAFELSLLMSERIVAMQKLNEKDKEIRKKLRFADSQGWKGVDELTFENIGEKWTITEHRKDKLTGEVANAVHTIEEEHVTKLWLLIKSLCPTVGTATNYRKLVPCIIETYHLPIEIEEFNGGKNRAKYYFPLYYYCMKILEHLEKVRYGGRGKTVRLRE